MVHLSHARQSPLLYLGQCSATTQEANDSHHSQYGQRLEQIPASVVHEEDELDAGNRAEEGAVGKRCVLQSFRKVVEVATQVEPLQTR